MFRGLLLFFLFALAMGLPAGMARAEVPAIRLHYLGHSSFLIRFDNGVSVLTDYGFSRAYGLPSPVHDIGDFQPTIVTYSHRDQDHDRGKVFDNAIELRGKKLSYQGIEFIPYHTSEGYKNSNISYLITYKGLSILHMGDAQGDIVNIGSEEERKLLKSIGSGRLDLLLIPIGWTKDILKEAEMTVGYLKPKRVIPIHYWYPETKRQFLQDLAAKNAPEEGRYEITAVDGPDYALSGLPSEGGDAIQLISLEPQPFKE